MLASSSGIIHSLCFFVLGVKLWNLGHKYGYRTQIQYFRDRFESDKIGLLLFPVLVGLVIPYLLIGVMAAGGVINGVTQGRVVDGQVTNATFEEGTFPEFLEQGEKGFAVDGSRGGVPRQLASLVICCVVLIYVFFGGMRGTALGKCVSDDGVYGAGAGDLCSDCKQFGRTKFAAGESAGNRHARSA